jgi:hypothetical protein
MNNKIFPYIVAISAFLVAFNAAFFSVYGLSKLFAGAATSVIFMAGSLEFSKLVAASFLFRYWKRTSGLLKVYLTTGVVVLVFITSAGIFGYLSNAYQGATIGFQKESTKVIALEERLDNLQEDKRTLIDDRDFQISELPENYRTAKRKLRADFGEQIKNVNTEILSLKSEIGDLNVKLIDTGVDVGPAIYLAKVFRTDVDEVVKFFIFILIFVFDPLAVAMVIAANQALLTIGKGEKQIGKDEVVEGGDDDDDSLFNLMKDKLKSKVKESMSTKEKMEILVPETNKDDSVTITKPGTYVVEEEKPKKKTEDLYGESKEVDKASGAIIPNRK